MALAMVGFDWAIIMISGFNVTTHANGPRDAMWANTPAFNVAIPSTSTWFRRVMMPPFFRWHTHTLAKTRVAQNTVVEDSDDRSSGDRGKSHTQTRLNSGI